MSFVRAPLIANKSARRLRSRKMPFDVPDRTILSGLPLGRIESQRNPANFVNSARSSGSRMGQLALRLVF